MPVVKLGATIFFSLRGKEEGYGSGNCGKVRVILTFFQGFNLVHCV